MARLRRDRPTGGPSWLPALAILGVLGFGGLASAPVQAGARTDKAAPSAVVADFAGVLGASASDDARQTADWVIRSGDNQGLPFIIVDKKDARVFVFDGGATLRGVSTALLGLAVGDESAPGVGDRPLSAIPPEQRTTAAGRFVAALGPDLTGHDVLWIDYEAALALHRVVESGTRQHRLERLAAPSVLSRRVTFGCINVPAEFYEDVVRPQFRGTLGIVYILPETRTVLEVFPGQGAARSDADARPRAS
ncbi:MAG: L,D-transpeptidase [Brevundimonas sp.]